MDAPLTKREHRVSFHPDGYDDLLSASCAVAYPLSSCHDEHHKRARVYPRFRAALKRQNYRYTNGQWKAQEILSKRPIASRIVACRVFDNNGRLIFSFASTPSFLRVWKEDNAPFTAAFTPRKKGKQSVGKKLVSTVSLESLQTAHEATMDRILGRTYTDSQRRPGYPFRAVEEARGEAEELGEEDVASLFDTMIQEACTLHKASKGNRTLENKAKLFWQERMAS